MKLIRIGQSGVPEEPLNALPEIACEVCSATVALYGRCGFVPPWIGYLSVNDGELIGTCGFKGPPSSGRVEIAYFTFPEFQRRGHATQMARELIAIATATDPTLTIAARTLREENASTALLRRLGFCLIGSVLDPEDGDVWEWHFSQPGSPAETRQDTL